MQRYRQEKKDDYIVNGAFSSDFRCDSRLRTSVRLKTQHPASGIFIEKKRKK